ncbi:MAG: hypothetical protein IKP64_03815 [Selenomonadaceae bacterium]|nr:hypothetical protein [Selenomonadaceae bacterium]
MNSTDIMQRLSLLDLDAVTVKELVCFIERKLDEQERIKGQIAKDLRRIGEMAFLDPTAFGGGFNRSPLCRVQRSNSND